MSALDFCSAGAAGRRDRDRGGARGGRAARRGAARRPTVAAHAIEPLPPGAVVPALAAPNIADVRGGRPRRRAGARRGSAARARRVALVIPDTVAKVSLVRFDKVPPKRRRSAGAGALADAQERAVSDRAGGASASRRAPRRAEGGQEFVVARRARGHRRAVRAGVRAGRRARRPRRSRDLQHRQRRAGRAGARRPATGCWCTSTPTYTTLTVLRDAHVIFFRNRADEAEGTLADVVHQTAMYYEDRLKGAGFSARAARRRRGGAGRRRRAAAESRGAARRSRSSRSIRARRPRWWIASARRRSCSTRWRRSSASCCASGRRPDDAAHQPLDPAVLQRARRPRRHRGGGRARRRR